MSRNVEFDRELAVSKAKEVFWEKGYNCTSMQDLVQAMKINRSSLYNTIGDKQQLFLECIESYVKEVVDEATKKAEDEISPLNALTKIIRDKAEWVVDCEKGCLGMKTIFEMAPNDEDVRKILMRSNDSYNLLISGLVQKAMDAGEIDSSEDASLMAEYIMTTFTGWKQSFILNRDPIKIKKMSEFLIRSITHK
ncbi:MAG: TetR/AcrR family transcriptional regulator [Chitinophagaceae bacterium]|nr:MAG: TetR/AcrR family transcriptional regulator [Chitinophagaceae bacterium]